MCCCYWNGLAFAFATRLFNRHRRVPEIYAPEASIDRWFPSFSIKKWRSVVFPSEVKDTSVLGLRGRLAKSVFLDCRIPVIHGDTKVRISAARNDCRDGNTRVQGPVVFHAVL